ncbi:hypothetical protein KA047_01635 [Candidatus Saccharibacteria bacterium]|jgi:hypothetical protein|nr:hypothetical protein [Candidatus Saccharibacteria bacterium]
MKKPLLLFVAGLILLVLPAFLVIHGNAVYNTAQCIATFEGQNSLVCSVGGSSTLANAFLGLSFIGLVLIVVAPVQYFRSRKER